jgi:ketosteroid isomerase-like protein
MPTNTNRTAQDVFHDHAQAMASGDLARIVSDYADDAVFITHAGVLHDRQEAAPTTHNRRNQ